MTAKEILAEYFLTEKGKTIAYHTFENSIVYFGRAMCGVMHNVGTYQRAFRQEIMNGQPTFLDKGIRLVEKQQGKKYKEWEVQDAFG